MLQGCFNDVSKKIQVWLNDVWSMFQGNQRGVLRVFHMYFKRVSGCFKNVSIVVEGIFKGVSKGELKRVSWKFQAVSWKL